MPYAIVQTASSPDVDRLKRAFRSIKSLTDADAVKLANEACGILMKNLSRDDASALQSALQSEGVQTEMVDADQLPRLPDAKFVKRIAVQPEALTIYDPLGRAVPLQWQHVTLVSAGVVRHFGVSTTRKEEVVRAYDPIRGAHNKVVTDVRHKVEDDAKIVLDIFLARGAVRFQVEAENFHFKYLFDRPDLNLREKVGLLVQMLTQHAPHALLNDGAAALRDNVPTAASYASKAALFDESVWLLWRLGRRTA